MPLPAWPEGSTNPVPPCKTEREAWSCPNLKDRENDTDMNYEHYDCKVCGRHVKLDYDEMR
jgi:hypothetical protein